MPCKVSSDVIEGGTPDSRLKVGNLTHVCLLIGLADEPVMIDQQFVLETLFPFQEGWIAAVSECGWVRMFRRTLVIVNSLGEVSGSQ